MKRIQVLVFMGLFISMEIILTRFFSIQTPILRIGFGFLPIALSAIMFGPIVGGVTAALADVIGMMLFPSPAGPYFPGFTLSALLGGVIYGLILYRQPKSIFRIALAVLLITLLVDLGLNTLWVSILYKKAWMAIITARIIKSTLMYPVQVALIFTMWRYLGVYIENILSRSKA